MTAAVVANGGRALAAVLAATPAAPLAPFVAFFSSVLGGWASDNTRAKVAQRYLSDTQTIALQQAYYEGYVSQYNQGVACWNAGLYERAQQYFDAAKPAGEANRLKVAQLIDEKEAASYRAWMTKEGGGEAALDAHLWSGWLLGDAGIRGHPNTREFNTGTAGGWVQLRRSDGVTVRWAPRPGHPDYNGTAVPPLPAATVERMAAVRAERERRALAVEASGRGPGSYMSSVKDDKRNGMYEEFEYEADAPPAPPPPPPPAPPSPPPAPPPPAPPPASPAPPSPPPPVQTTPVGVPPGRKGRQYEV